MEVLGIMGDPEERLGAALGGGGEPGKDWQLEESFSAGSSAVAVVLLRNEGTITDGWLTVAPATRVRLQTPSPRSGDELEVRLDLGRRETTVAGQLPTELSTVEEWGGTLDR